MSDQIKQIIINRGPAGLAGSDGAPGTQGPQGTTAATPISYAEIASPSPSTLASANVFRAPNGAGLFSDGTRLRPLGRTKAGRSIVLFQSSGGARGNAVVDVLSGQMSGNGSLLTFATDTNLLLNTGAGVLLGASSGAPNGVVNSIDDITVLGKITRTGTKQATMPYSGPAGVTTVKFDLLRQEQYGPPSIFRELNRLCGGSLKRLATWAIGGQNSRQKLAQYRSVIALAPDIVYGDMGANNDILDNTPIGTTTANIDTMVTAMLAAGIEVWWPLSPAITVSTPARVAKAKLIDAHMRELAAANPNIVLIDQYADTVDPATGLSYPALIADGLFHQSQEGAGVYGRAIFEALLESGRINRGWPDLLVSGADDRKSQDATSNQLYEGNFATTGLDASTLDSKAVGEVDPGVGDITTTGNAGRSLVCSYVEREDGVGKDTWGVYAATAGDTVTINWTGPAGALLKDLVGPGRRYAPALDFAIWQDVPGTISGWELVIDSQMSYPGSNNVFARPSAYNTLDVNAAEPAMTVAAVGPAYFPEFDAPAGLTATTVLAFTLYIRHAVTGISRFRIGRVTFRDIT